MAGQSVLQFKVTLRDINPPVWRRIQVPAEYSFWDLHVAIQDAMGWFDDHLHQFTLRGPGERPVAVGIPDEQFPSGREPLPGWEVPVVRYLSAAGDKAKYEYDFGDGWEHDIVLEGILPAEAGQAYPRCLEGERACPPEDCGGAFGYAEILEAMADPAHERHEEVLEWVGGWFDPDSFDADSVEFDDPKERWEKAFSG